jgi:thioredoxin-like negative regulator of GroEL
VDTSAKVATQYLLTALPVTYFVDAQGRIVGSALGPQSVASFSRWVGRLTKSP